MYKLSPDCSKIGFSAALYLPSRVGVNRICVGRYLRVTAAQWIYSHLWSLWAAASRGDLGSGFVQGKSCRSVPGAGQPPALGREGVDTVPQNSAQPSEQCFLCWDWRS